MTTKPTLSETQPVELADYECENCIGMIEHGCYCKALGAVAPGGPLPETKPAQAPDIQSEEALKLVFEAAYGLCMGYDWNNGTHAKLHGYRRNLLNAVNAIREVPDFKGKCRVTAQGDAVAALRDIISIAKDANATDALGDIVRRAEEELANVR